ncbi:MAG: helix-turn-helix domain-containing protein [Streptosporangiaceae bacterium]
MLRTAREAAGLSLSEVAARTHYTRGHLSNVETGRRTASAEVVLAYERVLGEGMDRGRRVCWRGSPRAWLPRRLPQS